MWCHEQHNKHNELNVFQNESYSLVNGGACILFEILLSIWGVFKRFSIAMWLQVTEVSIVYCIHKLEVC